MTPPRINFSLRPEVDNLAHLSILTFWANVKIMFLSHIGELTHFMGNIHTHTHKRCFLGWNKKYNLKSKSAQKDTRK